MKQQKMANTRVVIEGSLRDAPAAEVQRPVRARSFRRSDEGVVVVRSRGRTWEDEAYGPPRRRRYRDVFDEGYGDLY